MLGLMIDTAGHAALLYLSSWWICVQTGPVYWPPISYLVRMIPREFNMGVSGLGLWLSCGRDHRLTTMVQPYVLVDVQAYHHVAKPCDHQWEVSEHSEDYDFCRCSVCGATSRWYDDERRFVIDGEKYNGKTE
jgi:hypothetical protein